MFETRCGLTHEGHHPHTTGVIPIFSLIAPRSQMSWFNPDTSPRAVSLILVGTIAPVLSGTGRVLIN